MTLEPLEGEDPEDLVAVDDPASGVDRDEPIGVAVEREPDVRAGRDDGSGEGPGSGGAAVDVDVHAVGVVADHLDARAGRGEDLGRRGPTGPVRAVEHDPDVRGDPGGEREPGCPVL